MKKNICQRNVGNTHSAKCLPAKCPVSEMSVGKMSDLRNVCRRSVLVLQEHNTRKLLQHTVL